MLNWISLRSRPDVSCAVSTSASTLTVGPQETTKWVRRIWNYLAGTKHEVLTFNGTVSWNMTIAADVSLCPGGDRSRTGIVVLLVGCAVHRVCMKQNVAALSSCEAEWGVRVHGIKTGLGIRAVVKELLGPVPLELQGVII